MLQSLLTLNCPTGAYHAVKARPSSVRASRAPSSEISCSPTRSHSVGTPRRAWASRTVRCVVWLSSGPSFFVHETSLAAPSAALGAGSRSVSSDGSTPPPRATSDEGSSVKMVKPSEGQTVARQRSLEKLTWGEN